jgi:hypothetical protein
VSVIQSWSLYCDHPECETAGAWNADLRTGTARLLRAEAQRAGWTQRGNKDYCELHSTGGKAARRG